MQARITDQAGPPPTPWRACCGRPEAVAGDARRLGRDRVAVGVLTTPTRDRWDHRRIIAGLIADDATRAGADIHRRPRPGFAARRVDRAGTGPGLVRLGNLPITQVPAVPFGIVLGALIGTTVVTAFYRFPRLVLAAGNWGRPAG